MRLRRRGRTLLAGLVLVAAIPLQQARADDAIKVVLDQARIVKLPDKVGTIVVGNPLIADVSVQPGGLMVVTGKGYGRTNVIVLDRTGGVLLEKVVQVQGPRDNVVVYRGADRESYSCAPNCERRITLGDTAAFFDATLAQTSTRNGQATGAATTGASR